MKDLHPPYRPLTPEQIDAIDACIDTLNEMKDLVVVFDAMEQYGNLEDTIANAILKSIKYRVNNFERYFRPATQSAELEWCLVRRP